MGGRRRPRDPEEAPDEARPRSGCPPQRGLRRRRAGGALGAQRFPAWKDLPRLAGLGYLLGVVAFGIVWTPLLVRRRPVRRLGSSCRSAPLAGSRRGGQARAATRRHGVDAHPSGPALLVTGGRHRVRRTPARGVLPRGAPPEPPGVRRVGVLGAEGEGDLLLRGSRRAGVHTRRGRPTHHSCRSGRGRVPRDGERGHSHVPSPVLVPPPRRGRGARRLLVPPRACVASLAVAPRRARRTAIRRATAHAAGGRPRRRLLRRRRPAGRVVARRRCAVAAAASPRCCWPARR